MPTRKVGSAAPATYSELEATREGDGFRFVSVRTAGEVDGKTEQQVVIYGDVVD